MANGSHVLSATARDAAGNVTTSSLSVVVSNAAGSTRYVSDLVVVSQSNGWGPVERDRSNGEAGAGDGGPLTIGGVVYAKGLGVHAVSDVVYAVPSGCTSFTAQVGVDDEVGGNGSVVFEVWADGTKRVSSPRLTGLTTRFLSSPISRAQASCGSLSRTAATMLIPITLIGPALASSVAAAR